MTILPIVERELRVAARRRGTYRLRTAAACGAVALALAVILSAPARMASHEVSQLLFTWQAVLALAVCLFAGAFLTADCVSFEKREGTIGLLFLTDLRGYDLILGKLTSSSLVAAYALTATFPALALPLLMGGVTGAEFGRIVLVLVGTLLLSLATGIAISALGRDVRGTLLGTLAVMGAVTLTGPALAWFGVVVGSGRGNEVWLLGSPIGALIGAFESNYRSGWGTGVFWPSAGLIFAMAIGSLIFASLWIQQRWEEPATRVPVRSWRNRWARWRRGSPAWQRAQRLGLEAAPFGWLIGRDRLAQVQAWVWIATFGSVWFCLVVGGASDRRNLRDACLFFATVVAFALHVGFKVIVAVEASRRFNEDKRTGALELLLATDLSAAAILKQHRLALGDHFRAPVLTLVGVNFAMFLILPVGNPVGLPESGRLFTGEAFLLGAVVLASDFEALNWVGMLEGLRRRSHVRAVLSTLARVLLVPWLGVVGFIFITTLGGSVRDTELPVYAFVWFAIGFFLSLGHVTWARRELSRRFRRWAAGDSAVRATEGSPGDGGALAE